MKEDKQKPAVYNVLVHKLPKPNFHLLRALSAFLVTVVNNSEINKMDTRNVGIVFAPTLHIATPIILMFLTEFDVIFGDPVDESKVPSLEQSVPETLKADDIRSPRRQMFSDLSTPSYNQTSFASNQQDSGQASPANGFHTQQDLGFASLQPAYQAPSSQSEGSNSITIAGPEYGVARPRNLAPAGSAKQNRRESSMFLMNTGQKKSSLPMMRPQQGKFMTLVQISRPLPIFD